VENVANKTPKKPGDIGSAIRPQGVLEDGSLSLGDAAIAGDNVDDKPQDKNLASHQAQIQTDDVISRRVDNVSSGSGSGSGIGIGIGIGSGSGTEPGITSDQDVSTETVVSEAGEYADNKAEGARDPRTGLVS
jgi:hypothetical protein